MPEGYYQDIGNTLYKIYTALLLAKGCGLDVDFVWSSEELSDYRMLIMPSGKGMLTSQWDKLRRFVADGGRSTIFTTAVLASTCISTSCSAWRCRLPRRITDMINYG